MDHPLIAAAKRGDVAEVIRARDACGDLGAVRSPNTENTALHIAAATGDVAVLEALLPDTKRPARDVSGASAWHVDARNKNRDTPLMHALARARRRRCRASGRRREARRGERGESTPTRRVQRRARLRGLGAPRRGRPADVAVDQPDRLGRTALHYAACASVGCVAALLEAGANAFAREAAGLEPAAVAEREGHPSRGGAARGVRVAESAAAAAAAARRGGPRTTVKAKSAKKKKPKASVQLRVEETPVEKTRDVALAVAPGWAAAFAARAGTSEKEKEKESGDEKENGERAESAPARSPPASPSRGAATERLSPKHASDLKPTARLETEAPAPAPAAPARSWAAAAAGSGAAESARASAAPAAAAAAPPSASPARTTPRPLPTETETGWQGEARAWLERRHPTASALKVSLSNLLGVGVGEMSASQLEAAEDVHRDLLARLTDARVELARRQERARLEEAAAIERTIDQTLAAAGARR